jgi:hypothetical protein
VSKLTYVDGLSIPRDHLDVLADPLNQTTLDFTFGVEPTKSADVFFVDDADLAANFAAFADPDSEYATLSTVENASVTATRFLDYVTNMHQLDWQLPQQEDTHLRFSRQQEDVLANRDGLGWLANRLPYVDPKTEIERTYEMFDEIYALFKRIKFFPTGVGAMPALPDPLIYTAMDSDNIALFERMRLEIDEIWIRHQYGRELNSEYVKIIPIDCFHNAADSHVEANILLAGWAFYSGMQTVAGRWNLYAIWVGGNTISGLEGWINIGEAIAPAEWVYSETTTWVGRNGPLNGPMVAESNWKFRGYVRPILNKWVVDTVTPTVADLDDLNLYGSGNTFARSASYVEGDGDRYYSLEGTMYLNQPNWTGLIQLIFTDAAYWGNTSELVTVPVVDNLDWMEATLFPTMSAIKAANFGDPTIPFARVEDISTAYVLSSTLNGTLSKPISGTIFALLPEPFSDVVFDSPVMAAYVDGFDLGAIDKMHVTMSVDSARAYLQTLSAANVAKSKADAALVQSADASGQKLVMTRYAVAIAIEQDAVLNCYLNQQMITYEVTPTLYDTLFAPDTTFKTVQNRLNAMDDQTTWVISKDQEVDDYSAYSEGLEPYLDTAPYVVIAQDATTNAWSVLSSISPYDTLGAISVDDAISAYLNGWEVYNGSGDPWFDAATATASLPVTAADKELADLVDSVTFGGSWKSFRPELFISRGYPAPHLATAATDIARRCHIALKGTDVAPVEEAFSVIWRMFEA